MTITYNNLFNSFLIGYNLPEDFSFTVDIPKKVKKILNDEIIISKYGISLKSLKGIYNKDYDQLPYDEDRQNHFHVDWYIDPPDSKKAFMLGVKTLILLAERFEKEQIKGIRFWHSFSTPELGEQWVKDHNLQEEDDEYNISDRLSFYTRRDNVEVISINNDVKQYETTLIIDI